jgi:OOP family OmpA-OmpF porin
MTNRFNPNLTAAALAVALLSVAGAANATPGYVSAPSDPVVTSAAGVCVKTSFWRPSDAVAPCDAVASASVPAPTPVVAAPPPPAPAPQALAPAAPAPVIEKVSLESDVLFEFDKAQLRPEGQQKLDELADRIKDARVESIVAVGHADRIGPAQYNEKLSAERAQSVKQYLAQKGIEEQRVTSEGRGEAQPVTGDQCKGVKGSKLISCLQPDRRVEIEVRGTREVAGTDAGTGSAGATGGASSGSTPK